jgi:hypothetical protein
MGMLVLRVMVLLLNNVSPIWQDGVTLTMHVYIQVSSSLIYYWA